MSLSPSTPPAPAPASWISPALARDFAAAGTSAHRLASGPAGWAERFGDDVILSHQSPAALDDLSSGLDAWIADSGWHPSRVFSRFIPLKNADRVCPVLLRGDPSLPLQTVVTEAGIPYHLDIGASYSPGLFLDQRANRARLHSLRPSRLLNTFAYTCSFSVVAALAGAATLSVDLSRKSLDRGRRNFALNHLPETGHRFTPEDTLHLLPTLFARGERFDAIILDPPTFSRGHQGRRWRVEHDLEDLLNAALDVAAPRCSLLLSTNCARLDPASLERRARACAKFKRRAADYFRTPPLPDFPSGHGAATLWMLLR